MLVYSSGSLETVGYTDSDFRGDTVVSKIASEENLTNLFINSLPERVFERHVNSMDFRRIPDLL